MKKQILITFMLILLHTVGGVVPVLGETTVGPAKAPAWYTVLGDNVTFRGSVLGYALYQDVEESGLNPYNVLGIPRQRLQMDLQPDFYLTLNRLELEFKPRAALYHQSWDDGIFEYKDSEGDSDVYVNEWLARLRLTDAFFVSGGRENLQWGPSYLLSPSNPFYRNNGRNNPSLELPGMDYLRAVWIPSTSWTLSLIANVDEGQADIRDFEPVYAMKLDFTGEEKYFSLIGAYREDEDPEVGFFGGMTLSEALLGYTEGRLSAEEDAVDILGGASYTFLSGATASLEYFHQGSGCTREPIEDCVITASLYKELEDRFGDFDGTLDQLLDEIDDLDLDFESVAFIRKNYLLLQYAKPRIWDTLSLTLRWIYNIDDTSSRTVGIVNYELSDHFEIFAVGNLYLGDDDTEYGSLLNHSMMAGVTCSF